MYSILENRKNGMKEEILDFMKELIKTPSESLKEKDISEIVYKKMTELKYNKVFKDDAGNVVGLILGRESDPTILLNSHLDTVNVSNASSDIYRPRLFDGKLYGNGASDCKGGLAAQIFAGALLRRCMLPLRGNLIVAATVAEQNGVSLGIRELIAKTLPDIGLTPKYAILGEPTNMGLYYGHDGWVKIDIRMESSKPASLNRAVSSIFSDFRTNFANRMHVNSLEEFAMSEPVYEGGNGSCANIIVAKRLRANEAAGNAIGIMEHEIGLLGEKMRSVAVNVNVLKEEQKLYTGSTRIVQHITNAWASDPYSPVMERARHALSAAGCKVTTGKWELGRLGMGTAGSVLTGEFNIPTIGYGPGDESMAHMASEGVDINNIYEAAYGNASIIHSMIGIPVCGWTSDDI
ncbi:MAG: M20/M25/M40 family metallo-hydrolase [Victivallaceae bacterium]|jgi:acetylornithine deacetylase/succinyl-diaminopimelate desuccinylase-like protein